VCSSDLYRDRYLALSLLVLAASTTYASSIC